MFEELKGKKLLLLSGGALMCSVIEAAKDMGIYTIATDMYTDYSVSPGKRIADEAWDISWNDIDTLETKCREAGVDGVFTGFSEFCVEAAIRLCERLGLPFYASLEQLNTTRNKATMKLVCRRNGMPVPEEYKLSVAPTEEELRAIRYPVVVKPSDAAGSRGISICDNEEQLMDAIAKARAFSESDSLVAEKRMTGTEVNATYVIQDGIATLALTSDAIHGYQKEGGIHLTEAWLMPSKFQGEFIRKADQKCRDILHELKIENGMFQFAMFFDGEDFCVFDVGFRLGGGMTFEIEEAVNGINYMKMMLAHSLTGRMQGWNAAEKDDPDFPCVACNFTPTAVPGTVGHVGDPEAIRELPGVLSCRLFYGEGSEVPDSGAMNQNFARINMTADSPEALAETMDAVYAALDVRNDRGEDMLRSRVDRKTIENYWR